MPVLHVCRSVHQPAVTQNLEFSISEHARGSNIFLAHKEATQRIEQNGDNNDQPVSRYKWWHEKYFINIVHGSHNNEVFWVS